MFRRGAYNSLFPATPTPPVLEGPQAMDGTSIDTGETLPNSLSVDRDLNRPQITLSHLQIMDNSTESKPDNYRVSPVTSQSIPEPPAVVDVSSPGSGTETKTELELILQDWSTRGAHVDFQPSEKIPLEEGRLLGYGSMGGVYETNIRGHAFAWKRRICKRGIGDAERKEIEILKKVSHHHIVKLAGSYTHHQTLGLLLYPVAVCDLATFLEDSEAFLAQNGLERSQYERLKALLSLQNIEYSECDDDDDKAMPEEHYIGEGLKHFALSRMGCIVCAVEYLHGQKIRHKDLKPSNILISPEGLWLTDFGTATDFSLQTLSTTDNCERGTPKYFAPEIAVFKPGGRAADIFSLGCVLLEMHYVHQCQKDQSSGEPTLKRLRDLRSTQDMSFQANLDQIREWLCTSAPEPETVTDYCIEREICRMLKKEPSSRPSITEIYKNFALIDTLQRGEGARPVFGDCCGRPCITAEEHDKIMLEVKLAHKQEVEAINAEHAKSSITVQAHLGKEVQDLKHRIDLLPESLAPLGVIESVKPPHENEVKAIRAEYASRSITAQKRLHVKVQDLKHRIDLLMKSLASPAVLHMRTRSRQ